MVLNLDVRYPFCANIQHHLKSDGKLGMLIIMLVYITNSVLFVLYDVIE